MIFVSLSVVLPHLGCEVFRATLSQIVSNVSSSFGKFTQFSPDFRQFIIFSSILVNLATFFAILDIFNQVTQDKNNQNRL